MSDIFNFKRFRTYFVYDLRQMWRRHSKAALLIGGSIAMLYIVWVLFSLLFTQQWTTPSIEVRTAFLVVAFTILELYQARTYGYLTEKQAGSAWLLIPASRAEKFVSMLLMTLVVIPVLFTVVYFGIDGLLSLVDPTYGQSLIGGISSSWPRMLETLAEADAEFPVRMDSAPFILLTFIGYCCNFMYFLLCGLCFKKNKIGYGIVIIFGVTTALSFLMGLITVYAASHVSMELDEMQAARLLVRTLNGTMVFSCLLSLGLGWGIWRRIRTLQH